VQQPHKENNIQSRFVSSKLPIASWITPKLSLLLTHALQQAKLTWQHPSSM